MDEGMGKGVIFYFSIYTPKPYSNKNGTWYLNTAEHYFLAVDTFQGQTQKLDLWKSIHEVFIVNFSITGMVLAGGLIDLQACFFLTSFFKGFWTFLLNGQIIHPKDIWIEKYYYNLANH